MRKIDVSKGSGIKGISLIVASVCSIAVALVVSVSHLLLRLPQNSSFAIANVLGASLGVWLIIYFAMRLLTKRQEQFVQLPHDTPAKVEPSDTAGIQREFLSNAAHELKTPLFNIQGYLHIINDRVRDDVKLKQGVAKALKNTERLQQIVEDLLVLSKYETEQLHLKTERFDLLKLVQEEIENHSEMAAAKNISITFENKTGRQVNVLADKSSIESVLENLIGNSIKYGIENGQTIVQINEDGDKATVAITDNGMGIDEEHHTKIFTRFYRVDSHRSRDAGGTGLGLAIVHSILKAHGSTISLQSKPGVGSTFTFWLPKK